MYLDSAYIANYVNARDATAAWNLISTTDARLQRTAALIRALSPELPLRAGDAVHLATALDAGETEIWTNDRHVLGAANCVGLSGKSV